jgi:hypothetical protein
MVHLRQWQPSDQEDVEALFSSFVLELAPSGQQSEYETYIEKALRDDLRNISDFYRNRLGIGFWVATIEHCVVGMGGMELLDNKTAEIRRMS